MRETWSPHNTIELRSAVKDALASQKTLELRGTGSKSRIGRNIQTDVVLDLSKLKGIVFYEPEEMVITAKPGTPIIEIENLLTEHSQRLAFDPPDYGAILGVPRHQGTIGGAVMTGRAGSRRISAGAPRDHCLGVKVVNGFGDACAAGGRVVKNVTGFDISKLIAGSYGTLCALNEITLKTLPTSNDTITLALFGLNDSNSVEAMRQALSSSCQVSAAAHLPACAIKHFDTEIFSNHPAVTLLRLDGFDPTTRARAEVLSSQLNHTGDQKFIAKAESELLWKEISNAECFSESIDNALWHISVPPDKGPELITRLMSKIKFDYFYDWAGGSIWIEVQCTIHSCSSEIRSTIQTVTCGDGHATLIRPPAHGTGDNTPFPTLLPGTEELTRRIKLQFDPKRIFNPGRMYNWL